MLSYCLKCRKNTESKNPEVVKAKNGRIMLLSKSKKSSFLKEKEAKELLSRLGLKASLSQIPFLGPLLF